MTPLAARRQNIATNYYNISTTRTPDAVHYGGIRQRGISTIPGHLGFSRSQQHPHYFSLQKAHILRPLSTIGHQPHHHGKHSVFNTLAHRAKVVSTNQQSLHKELEHITKALWACSFPPWALRSLQNKF